MRFMPVLAASALVCACSNGQDASIPGNAQDEHPFSGIGEDEVIRLTGTEPFWGGEIAGGTMLWTTPDNIDGERIAVTRFAGRGGLSFSGELQGRAIDLVVTPAPCSDGMSDRSYPFTVTVQFGDDQLQGCGWSDAQPFAGGEG
jgi:uncharacterized membrane protein